MNQTKMNQNMVTQANRLTEHNPHGGGNGGAARHPLWWYLAAACCVFALLVGGTFVWWRSNAVSADRIYGELVALDSDTTAADLAAKGFVKLNDARGDWNATGETTDDQAPDIESYDTGYQVPDMQTQEKLERFVADVKAGRSAVLRTFVDQDENGSLEALIIWFDPSFAAPWAQPASDGNLLHWTAQPAEGKGMVRMWVWAKDQSGNSQVTGTDLKYSRGLRTEQDGGRTWVVMQARPAVPVGGDPTRDPLYGGQGYNPARDRTLYSTM